MKKSLAILILLFPLVVSAQLANYKASFSFGGGATQYFGDLSHRFVNLKLTSYSANAALQFKPTKGIGIELEYKYVNLFGDDRASYLILDKAKPNPNYNRSLNFKSTIHETNLKFYFYLNNGKIMSKYAVVSPYFFAGIGVGLFNSKSDLLSASGSYYYYWNDGTIRDLSEIDPLSASAQIINKDKTYETNLNNLETEAKYSNFKWQVPLGFGLNFKLSKSIYLSLQTEWVYNFTDYLDGVGNKPELTSYPNSFVKYAADPANTIAGTRGNDNKWKDSYLNTTMKFNFYFGNKENKISKNISSQIIVPIKDFNSMPKFDTIKIKTDATAIIKQQTNVITKDTVVFIYKLIENVYVEQPSKRDTIIIYKTISKIKADTIFQLDTVLKTNIQDRKINQKITQNTFVETILKTPITQDNATVFKQIDTVKIIRNTKIISDIITKKAVEISTPLLQDSSIIIVEENKKNEISIVPIQIKSDTVFSTSTRIKQDTITTSNDLKIENNFGNARNIVPDKITDTVVIINTNNNKDSIVLSNHLLHKNMYENKSNNIVLYDSINPKLETIISKNINTTISQKVDARNDTIYKFVQLNNLSKEQENEISSFKKENESLKIKLEKQKKYNDSLTSVNLNAKLNTQNINGNLQNPALNDNQNLRNTSEVPATNILPTDLQENITKENQRNNTSINQATNPTVNQDLLALKQEVEQLKIQVQNKNTITATPVITAPLVAEPAISKPIISQPITTINNDEIALLRTENENLKKINKPADTVIAEVKTPNIEIKNEDITLLKNEIEQLKNKKAKIDTVLITTQNNIKDEGLDSLKSDLATYKEELEKVKAKQKLAAESKPKAEPKDSLLMQIFFEINKTELNGNFKPELFKIFMILLRDPNAKLLLTGFADRDGDKNSNLKLSAERAQSVKNYFVVDKNVDYNRILMNYVGSNQSNTSDNKDYNRRVDVYLLK